MVEVEPALVRGVEREDAGVAVPLAEEGREAHEFREPLVLLEVVGSSGEAVRRGTELGLGDGMPRIWVDGLEPFGEPLDVANDLRLRIDRHVGTAAGRERRRRYQRRHDPHAGFDAAARRTLGELWGGYNRLRVRM
jgi:hypothetical protein